MFNGRKDYWTLRPLLDADQAYICDFLVSVPKKDGWTDKEVMKALNDMNLDDKYARTWEINQVSGRMSELRKQAFLRVDYKRACAITGNTAGANFINFRDNADGIKAKIKELDEPIPVERNMFDALLGREDDV